jgi:hypothetical protein
VFVCIEIYSVLAPNYAEYGIFLILLDFPPIYFRLDVIGRGCHPVWT